MPDVLEVTGAGTGQANGLYRKIQGKSVNSFGFQAAVIWQQQGGGKFAILQGPFSRVPSEKLPHRIAPARNIPVNSPLKLSHILGT